MIPLVYFIFSVFILIVAMKFAPEFDEEEELLRQKFRDARYQAKDQAKFTCVPVSVVREADTFKIVHGVAAFKGNVEVTFYGTFEITKREFKWRYSDYMGGRNGEAETILEAINQIKVA